MQPVPHYSHALETTTCCIWPSVQLPWAHLQHLLHGWGKGHDEGGWSPSVRWSGWQTCGWYFLTKMWLQIVFYTWLALAEIWMHCEPDHLQSRFKHIPDYIYSSHLFSVQIRYLDTDLILKRQIPLEICSQVMRHVGCKSTWLKCSLN